jgi:glutathione reductase (NADPH)
VSKETDFDLFVIGGGSGGVRAARFAARLGARVAICEDLYFGGTCVNVGCVPKKLFVYSAHYAEDFEDARAYGWDSEVPAFDWQKLRANKDKEIERLGKIYKRLLENAGVEVIDGRGTLDDENTVRVGDRTFSAKNILIATGGWPYTPQMPGCEHTVTSNEMFKLDELPGSIVIIGGGYIALEFASILHGFGVKVDIVHRGDQVLRGFDGDVRRVVARELEKKGIGVHTGLDVREVALSPRGGKIVWTAVGEAFEADVVLCAVGRVARTENMGLEQLGVKLDARGGVIVDESFRSSVPNIYAVGDCIHRLALTPVALAEGMRVANQLFGGPEREVSYDNVPTAVFSIPNVGTVGMTEEQARERGEVTIFKSEFTPMKHSLSGRDEKTFMKLVVDKRTDRVLGCHMVGPDAGEIVQGLAVALVAGATKAQFDATIGIHPTAAEEFVTMRTPASD